MEEVNINEQSTASVATFALRGMRVAHEKMMMVAVQQQHHESDISNDHHHFLQEQQPQDDRILHTSNINTWPVVVTFFVCVLFCLVIWPTIHCIRLYFVEKKRRGQFQREQEDLERARELSIMEFGNGSNSNISNSSFISHGNKKNHDKASSKRILIRQLCVPVSLKLDDEHFPHLQKSGIKARKLKEEAAIKIPVPGLYTNLAPGLSPAKRTIPGICAICVQALESHANIVWSSNPDCPHVFHQKCIEDSLLASTSDNGSNSTSEQEQPLQDEKRPSCPVCAQDFLVLPITSNRDINEKAPSPDVLAFQSLWPVVCKNMTRNGSHSANTEARSVASSSKQSSRLSSSGRSSSSSHGHKNKRSKSKSKRSSNNSSSNNSVGTSGNKSYYTIESRSSGVSEASERIIL